MRLKSWLLGATALLSCGVATAAPFSFSATLDGAQESPPVASAGTGTGTGTLNGGPGTWVFTYSLTYSGLTGTIAAPFAHIHQAPAGANGPIVHNLDGASLPPIAGSTSGTIIGDWRFDDATQPLTDTLAGALLAGNTYFNLHTSSFPPGEIRGQILRVSEPGTALLALVGFGLLLGLFGQGQERARSRAGAA
jgi:hypothetical protein